VLESIDIDDIDIIEEELPSERILMDTQFSEDEVDEPAVLKESAELKNSINYFGSVEDSFVELSKCIIRLTRLQSVMVPELIKLKKLYILAK
jgi:hypothetical protein